MLCVLIVAEGKGERFWPLTTEEKPKQFLNLLGKDTMIQMTVKRIERIFIVTGEKYVELLKEQVPNLLERNIIIEPTARNTAPCIALSAFIVEKYYKNSSMVVVPSDHLIVDEEKYIDIINITYEFINKTPKAIVTLGIKPDRAETGDGYIEVDHKLKRVTDFEKIHKVERFVEKLNIEKAQKYIKDGNYLWNSGIFT